VELVTLILQTQGANKPALINVFYYLSLIHGECGFLFLVSHLGLLTTGSCSVNFEIKLQAPLDPDSLHSCGATLVFASIFAFIP